VEKYYRAGQVTDGTIQRTCIACLIPKATNTHSEHEILIDFSLQQWLHEHISVLCYTYTAYLMSTKIQYVF